MKNTSADQFPFRTAPPRHERTGSPPALTIVRTGNPIVDAAGEFATREREAWLAVSREIDALREANAEAKANHADADAFAAARLVGRKDPGPVNADAYKALVADLIRRRNGLLASIAIADGAFRDAVRDHAAELEDEAVARLARCGDRLRVVADAATSAVNDHAEAMSFAIWLQAGPSNPQNRPRPAVVIDGTKFKMLVVAQGFHDLAGTPTGFEPVVGNRFHDPADPKSLPALAVPGVAIPPRLRTRGPGGDGPPSAA